MVLSEASVRGTPLFGRAQPSSVLRTRQGNPVRVRWSVIRSGKHGEQRGYRYITFQA